MGLGRTTALLTVVLTGLYLKSSSSWPGWGGLLTVLTFNYIVCWAMARPWWEVGPVVAVPLPAPEPAPVVPLQPLSDAPVQRHKRVGDGTWAAVHADGQQTLYTVEPAQGQTEVEADDDSWPLYDPDIGHPPR